MDVLYVLIAAASGGLFGYVAMWLHKRHEVERDIALEIDADLREALDLALLDTVA